MKRSLRIYMETYGCSANQAESEIMGGLLAEAGFELVNTMEDSDFVIINTCFVKTPTEQKIRHRISEIVLLHPEKKLIIAGCMPEVMDRDLNSIAPGASMVSTHNITRIVEAAKRTATGERVIFTGKTKEKKPGNPRARKNRLIGITELSQGCNGNCAYCCVRLAKGMLHCYSPADIVKDVANALKEGCREIWLTSQDNAAYFYAESRLPGLVDRICKIKGDFKIRIGMMNPGNVIKITDDLINTYKSKHVYKFLHLPVQSGSGSVLKAMKRGYKASDFEKIVSKFRKSIPSITLSTDIIVGFPGETDLDFEETKKIIEKIKPDIVNVAKFGARPGTDAAAMPPVDNRTIKERSAELSKIVRGIALERNKEWIDWQGPILVTEKGKKERQFVGRNFAYKPVLIESKPDLLGKRVNVKIKNAEITHLQGVIK